MRDGEVGPGDGLREVFPGGEVPVERADADSGRCRDRTHVDGKAVVSERVFGGPEPVFRNDGSASWGRSWSREARTGWAPPWRATTSQQETEWW
nr:hypothetical protein GCM10010200_076180 [Actinomadura rugatobispora]